MYSGPLGQMFFTGISGTSLTDFERDFLQEEKIGGVILFSKNYQSPTQLAELVNSIQMLRDEYPLFIAVDHEGGRVLRFRSDFTQFPSMMAVASTNSPKICFEVHKIMAEELLACGVNLNFSPCCDILTNKDNKVIGDRAFGKDAETVEKFVSAAIRGLQTGGVLACAKHFPGHGDTLLDSHEHLPHLEKSREDLAKQELIPFVKAVKSRVEFVMMSHIMVDGIDKEYPVSLSFSAHQILRKEFKYSKIIITDDMQMKAITDNYGVSEAPVMALTAGADMLIYRDMVEAQKALIAVKNSLKTMKIKNEVIDEKIKTITDCKKSYFKDYSPIYVPDVAKKIGTKQSEVFLNDIKKKMILG